jgi:hypothetical protein
LRRAALIAVAVAATAAVPASAEAKTYFLDSYQVSKKPYAGPLKTERLARGIPYKIAVRGTFSLFSADEIRSTACGAPEPTPIYPSRKRSNGAVVADAEFLFADVSKNCARRPSVQTGSSFQVKTSTRYRDLAPIGGAGTAPKPNHLYTYAATGVNKFASFRLVDEFTRDNYGRLRITISRARATDCALGGFANWKYADEATCVAATQRKLPKRRS